MGEPKKSVFIDRKPSNFVNTTGRDKSSAPNAFYKNTKDFLNDLKASNDKGEVVIAPKVNVSKKSKVIKKVTKKVTIKGKHLEQLKLDSVKTKMRLRGKTLDLTTMGVINTKRATKTPAP